MNITTLAVALDNITSARLLEHITTLASELFEGRAPGTVGEVMTIDYLIDVCRELKLEPVDDGDIDGADCDKHDCGDSRSDSYLQTMTVTGLTAHGQAEFYCAEDTEDKCERKSISLKPLDEIVVRSQWWQEQINVDSDVVFVGYGIVAPEYDWDDYKGLDVRGKTVVMLIGDPSRPDQKDATKLDQAFFKGNTLSYYGRWTYKFEIASQKGAAAALIVHDTKQAGYGWDVVVASWGGENFGLSPDPERVQIEGWFSHDAATKLFQLAGHNFDNLRAAAQVSDFRPIELAVQTGIAVTNTMRTFSSSNVVAKLTGSDPLLKNECLVYSAHWDHFGKREKDGEVEILSGALDNGSGVAVVIEIARAIAALSVRPKRSIVFLFTTLEEHGLLGAQHYVLHPVVPLEDTVAVINFDILNPWGRTRNLISVARGHSSLDEILERHAALQGRTIGDDMEPEKGYFFRSDHLEFIRKGVPALFFLNPGADFIGQPADYAEKRRIEYLTHCYHKAADKVNPAWDLSGMVEDAQLLFATGMAVADSESRPNWKAGSEFYPRSCSATK